MSKAERTLPVVLAGSMFALVAVFLPSVLRPAEPPANESAEFSPDAPPDQNNSIVAALNRGSTGTAGDGEGEATDQPDGPPKRAPGKGVCYGKNPPRQVESVYSPPCAPAFVGDNGGATTFGVTATEFRVAIYVADYDDAEEGPVDSTETYQNATQRYLLAMQTWFNKHFEFYRRQMRIFIVKQSLTSNSEGASAAIRAKQQFQVFAAGDALTTNPGTFGESIRQKIVTWMGFQNDKFLNENAPYAWTFITSNDNMVRLSTEALCKQVVDKPPKFNERRDTTFDYKAPRKLGLLLFEDSIRTGMEKQINDALAACGGKIDHTVKFAFEDEGAAGVAGAMTQMRSQGITTILHYGDHFSLNLFTAEATRLDYWPEWFIPGTGGTDVNSLSQDQDQDQWHHAFGLSMLQIPRPPHFADDVRAVREIDPSNNYSGEGGLPFAHLFGIASGVQLAGPKLTPESFEQGLFKLPHRPPEPIWSQGGGYGPGDHSYIDYAMFIYYDKNAYAADNGAKGSYRYLFDGKHFTYGEMPRDPVPWMTGGITTPPDPTIRDNDPSDVEGGS
ncbi:MAG TPA: hypothetical protein VMZ22_14250 [Acidimicrobiales bacterium]|nr:hypothetical protein [Acidimicrobiales bacterium]